ncbi:MAG: tetratricopeptide repeat protein [Sandaracinaceae bacterium]|nr:tetratricopeptide repeat protein [Sandaracinaceae bacterium]
MLALAGSSLSLAACWTSQSTGDDLVRRVTALESGASQQRAELEAEVQTAQTKVGELEKVLEQATRVVTRASADTGAQVETLQQQVQALEGQLAELRNEVSRQQSQLAEQQADMERQLKKIASRVGIEPTLDPSQIPADADAHWTAAQQAYDGRDWGRARALYRAFVERHREEPRADDAQYRIGMTFMEEQRPATALGELRRVIADFPRGDAVDDALLAMGDAFYALHACTDARAALDTLVRTQPSSPLINAAREKLRVIQRAPRGYCTS